MTVVGIHGNSRAGKDSVAGFYVQDFDFVQRNMATPIREMLLQLDPLLEDGLLSQLYKDYQGDWDQIKAASREAVEWMIRLGQSARDVIGENVWLDIVLKNPPDRLIIADVRQPNEYNKIKELGGQVLLVTRPGTEARGMDSLLKGYEFDAHIENSGTIEDLRKAVRHAYGSSR